MAEDVSAVQIIAVMAEMLRVVGPNLTETEQGLFSLFLLWLVPAKNKLILCNISTRT